MRRAAPGYPAANRELLNRRTLRMIRNNAIRFSELEKDAGAVCLSCDDSPLYKLNSSRSRLVCARLTGISVCCLSFMRSW